MAVESTLEFRLLGPFDVSERGQPLDVGSGKQHAVLAVLLLHGGEVVSTDRLIDALWGERAPPSAVNSIHIYVSRLRKALGHGRLDTHGHGYRIRFEPEELDLARFERLLAEGRESLVDGDAARAAELLEAGLALWRGPPLADFAFEPFAQGEIARLEELWIVAVEERIDADLALGRHAKLVSELDALVREHALRERLHAQLMLALYRSGRQADALAAYQQARRTLRDELGLEPGRALQELERDILRQEADLDPPGRASGSPVRAPRRSGVLIAVGAALLLSAAVAVAGIQLTRDESPGLAGASANSVAAVDVRSNRLVADVPVGNGPTSVAAGAGSVWVTNAHDGSVSRIDPSTSRVLQRIDVGGDPSGIAVGGGAVWVANSSDGSVSRIDVQTNREVGRIPVGVRPTALAIDRTTVWVTSAEERSVSKIDISLGRVVARIPTGALGRGVAVGGGSAWVTDESSRSVVRIDARRRHAVRTLTVGNGPTAVVFGAGSVWVANSLDGTVARIDPRTNRVAALIRVGEGPDGLAFGSGAVWVSSEFSEAIVRIDPAANRVVERVPIANRPKGLAVVRDLVWFAVQASGTGHRGGRLIVDGGITGSIDPSYMNWDGTIGSLSTAYDGLVGYARRSGNEGARIVPNLAASLPTITAAGTRYSFQLRRGIRYSNGTPVRASDFRRSLERMFLSDFPPAIPLVGAESCQRQPRTCDLSKGIGADDETQTVVFHLRRAGSGSDVLRELAFRPPIPRDVPSSDQGTRPVPSTGPYTIESYLPGRALTLVRNPYFRVSKAVRPDGFPDEIVFRERVAGDDGVTAGITAVEQGRVDLTSVPSDSPEALERLERFRARHPSQVQAARVQATVLLFLNTTQRPFDDVRVRRAVNLAVDRTAIARATGGQDFAQPTCQLRPPGTVGFRRYCPYTAATSETGEWKAPDLVRARRLVVASGTRGTSVTIWTFPHFWEPAARGAAQALSALGYRVAIRYARDLDDYVARIRNETTRGVQAGISGWYGVPRAAASLLDFFMCRADASFFCDRRIDARIERARKLDESDQSSAVAQWAKIERDIVDLAPWVPLFTPGHVGLVSKRVGNYQRHPEYGVLLDQIWVR